MRNKHKPYDGFTIVELLIVIVIIGILAAISIVAYNGVQNNARESVVKSDLSNTMKQLGIYIAEHDEAPITADVLGTINIKPTRSAYMTSRNNFYYCANRTTKEYAIGAITKDNRHILAKSSSGIQAWPGSGIDMNRICQSLDLTGSGDPNAYANQGYTKGTNTWSTWIK